MAGNRGPDTIYALSSGRPPAAIAIIRLSGPEAHVFGAQLCGSLPEPRQAAVRSLRHPQSRELLDEALVLRFDRPHSATGEDLVEFHCHGGRAVIEAVLTSLGSNEMLRLAEPGEFTRRALENGRIDLTEAEGLADLLEAETEAQRRSALALADGGLRRQIEEWRIRLLDLSAQAELAIDYVGEDEEIEIDDLADKMDRLRDEIEELLSRPRMESLKEGVRVVIAGPPNAGKSSLLNALVGHERAIVAAEAGTTRDHIDIPLALEGIPILLTDTAGLRVADDEVEAIGIGRAEKLIERAQILLWLGDPNACPPHPLVLCVRPKADLGAAPRDPRLAVSSVSGEGLGPLLHWIAGAAKELTPEGGAITLNARHAGELGEAIKAMTDAHSNDPLLIAEALRAARNAFDRVTGRAGIEDFLDALFGRFCLGK